LECRNCHSAESIALVKQGTRAAEAHQHFLFTGEKTRIDCHKGIAHKLPAGAYDFGSSSAAHDGMKAMRAYLDAAPAVKLMQSADNEAR